MKNIKIIILVLCLGFGFAACNSDDDNYPSKPLLIKAIDDATSLIETTSEGVTEGDYAPGSKSALQGQIDWGNFILKNSDLDTAFVNAGKKVNDAIAIYKENIVKAAYPLFGAGSYFDLGTFKQYNIYEKFTVECKVRFNDFGTGLGNIIAAEGTGGGMLLRYNDNKLDAYISNGGWIGGTCPKALEVDKWYHLAFVFTGRQVKLYIDGVEEFTTGLVAQTAVTLNDNIHFNVGANPSMSGRYMRGNITQVSIWDYARSASEIQTDVNPNFTGSEQGLLAYWPFIMNIGSDVKDITGKYTAKATGVVWQNIN